MTQLILLTLLFLTLLPTLGHAGANVQATILVHLSAPAGKNACALESTPPSCSEIQTQGLIDTDYLAYVIFSDLSPSAGLSWARFGVTYDSGVESGVDVHSWTICADGLEFPGSGWPAAGTGNTLTWTFENCHPPTVEPGVAMAVAGYFYVIAHGPDEIRVTPHPSYNQAKVVDCAANEDIIEMGVTHPFGWATFSADGSSGGSSPCGLNNGSCHLNGPAFVSTGETGVLYTMNPEEVTPTGSWVVTGNAVIASSDNAAAMVNAAAPGAFTITYRRLSDCVEGCGCSLTVQVFGPVEVTPTTWGRIKAGY